jgi:hypothetical protein
MCYLETNPLVEISTGPIYFDIVFKSGTGGKETTICHK